MKRRKRPVEVIGWREWIALPELGIARIKAKVDTGARSSALHAFDMQEIEVDGKPWLRFNLHPIQRDSRTVVASAAPLVGHRMVRPSSGRATLRPVIRTRVKVGKRSWPIEITLIRRDLMGFRLLLGRQAVRHRFVVNPGRSFLIGPGGGSEADGKKKIKRRSAAKRKVVEKNPQEGKTRDRSRGRPT